MLRQTEGRGYKMDLPQRAEFYQLYFFENFVLVLEFCIKSWFDVPTTQMFIFIFSENVGVLFEGSFSLWLSLIKFYHTCNHQKVVGFLMVSEEVGDN